MNQADPRFRLPDDLARDLASQFGTPLYVVDEATLRDRVQQYSRSLKSLYPKTELSFASKANSTFAVLKIVHSEGATIDVASEGELRAALLAGIPASDCHLHGNNKKREELKFALDQGVSHVAIDHFGEIEMISELIDGQAYKTKYWLRLAPGVDPKTHSRISTGQSDTKFGFNIADRSAEKALVKCLERGIPVEGIHCHVGSQLLDGEAQEAAGEFLSKFAADMKEKHGFSFESIIIGGGLGVKYTAQDDPATIADYCEGVIRSMLPILEQAQMTPTIGMEPGRSMVGEAGVTLYTVGVVKTVPIAPGQTRTFVAVDGGLSDNPRPAMYEAKYEVLGIRRCDEISEGANTSTPNPTPSQERALAAPYSQGLFPPKEQGEGLLTVTVCGKHCETDTLFQDVEVPKDLEAGDLLQVLTTGAYNSTMANNYNRYPRPGTVLIRQNGTVELVVRRDTWEEMFDKETVPGDI